MKQLTRQQVEHKKIAVELIRKELQEKGRCIVLGLGTFTVAPVVNRPETGFKKKQDKIHYKNRVKFKASFNMRGFIG